MKNAMKKVLGLLLISALITTNVSANTVIITEQPNDVRAGSSSLETCIDPPVATDPD